MYVHACTTHRTLSDTYTFSPCALPRFDSNALYLPGWAADVMIGALWTPGPIRPGLGVFITPGSCRDL